MYLLITFRSVRLRPMRTCGSVADTWANNRGGGGGKPIVLVG